MNSDYVAGIIVGGVGLVVLFLYLQSRGSLPKLNARGSVDTTNASRQAAPVQKLAESKNTAPYEIGQRVRSPFDVDLGTRMLQPYNSASAARAARNAPVRPKDAASIVNKRVN